MFTATFEVTVGEYTLICLPDGLPDMYSQYYQNAALVDEFDLQGAKGKQCCLAVRRQESWPFLVVAQRYQPEIFDPSAIIIPETNLLFIGAGVRILAYKLDQPQRLWEDEADTGFWSWARHGNYVIMSAELELAVWDVEGRKQWSTFVEPPWDYSVKDGVIYLEVMGKKSNLLLETGRDTL